MKLYIIQAHGLINSYTAAEAMIIIAYSDVCFKIFVIFFIIICI